MAAQTVLAAVRGSVKTSIYDSVLSVKNRRRFSNGDTTKSECAVAMLSLAVFGLRKMCCLSLRALRFGAKYPLLF